MGNEDLVKICSDGNTEFELPYDAAMMMGTFKELSDDVDVYKNVIPLPNVTNAQLKYVVEYCKANVGKEIPARDSNNTELTDWETTFLKDADNDAIFQMLLAANYTETKGMLDMLCCCVANKIKGKSPEELRKEFGIKKEFTEEEMKKVQKEHGWEEVHE